MTIPEVAGPQADQLQQQLAWSNDPEWKAQLLAEHFHATYERLAPSFGYETRPDTKAFAPTTPNGRLMIAVCRDLVARLFLRDSAVAAPPAQAVPVAPTPEPAKQPGWRIDTSAGREILVHDDCSVIEGELARHVLGLLAPTPEPVAQIAGVKPQDIILYSGDTSEPYIDIDGSDLWCNADDFTAEGRKKIRWMVNAARAALRASPPKGATQDSPQEALNARSPLELDAARYRWLRDNMQHTVAWSWPSAEKGLPGDGESAWESPRIWSAIPEVFDRAVDSAIAATEGEQP